MTLHFLFYLALMFVVTLGVLAIGAWLMAGMWDEQKQHDELTKLKEPPKTPDL